MPVGQERRERDPLRPPLDALHGRQAEPCLARDHVLRVSPVNADASQARHQRSQIGLVPIAHALAALYYR